MFDSGNNWELFGFDMRRIGLLWASAWREFLWGDNSPVKSRLDERVFVHSRRGDQYFQGGKPVTADGGAVCEAVLLPGDLVLSKTLKLPLAAEAELDKVMPLEITAHSPFPAGDTGYGWKLAGRGETGIQVQLAIVSLSAAMTFLGQEYDCHDHRTYEVWAEVDDAPVVIGGFGEEKRRSLYRRRLVRVGALAGYVATAVLGMFGLAAGFKYLELQEVNRVVAQVEREAVNASQLRSTLAFAGETIAVADRYLLEHPNPHRELARLTKLLGDDASVQQFVMNGRDIRIRGEATNAAEVMAQLTAEPAYAEVSAPQAMTKLGNTGLERFVFNIKLAGGES